MKIQENPVPSRGSSRVLLSVACMATDVEFQYRIIIRDHTVPPATSPSWRDSPKQPGLDYAPHTAPRPPAAATSNREA